MEFGFTQSLLTRYIKLGDMGSGEGWVLKSDNSLKDLFSQRFREGETIIQERQLWYLHERRVSRSRSDICIVSNFVLNPDVAH